MIKEQERAVLKSAVPAEGLEAGDVGTAMHIYPDGLADGVEFTTLEGDTAAVVTVEAADIRPVHKREITQTRELQAAGPARRTVLCDKIDMKTNPILEEIWRIKDELPQEFAAEPNAYFAKLDGITNAEEKAGRKVIRSAAELQQHLARRECHAESALVLNDKPSRKP